MAAPGKAIRRNYAPPASQFQLLVRSSIIRQLANSVVPTKCSTRVPRRLCSRR